MSILKHFTSVYVGGGPPYEQRELSYLFRLSAVPFSNAESQKNIQWNAESLFIKSLSYVGGYPGKGSIIGGGKIGQQDLLFALWAMFSERLGNEMSGARYYAEKSPHDVAYNLPATLKSKHVYLLRDPRDEYLSILRFNKMRGFDGFGVGQRNELEFADAHSIARKGFMKKFAQLSENDQALGLTYEALVQEATKSISKLEEFLGAKFLHEEWHRTARDNFAAHSTSASPGESIARWKKEMPKSVRQIFVKNLAAELQAVGYDLDT